MKRKSCNKLTSTRDQDGGHDLKQEGGVAHLVLKGAGYGVGVMAGLSFGLLAGVCAVIAKAAAAGRKKASGSHDKKTDFKERLSLKTLNLDTEVDIKINKDNNNIEFTDKFQDKIQAKQEEQKEGGLIIVDNLRPICSSCNLSMSNKYTITEWSKLIDTNSIKHIEDVNHKKNIKSYDNNSIDDKTKPTLITKIKNILPTLPTITLLGFVLKSFRYLKT